MHAAKTPNASHLTSLYLYIIRRFVGLLSGFKAFSPCCMVHFNFSTVTSISPSDASIFVFPESRHATVAMASWLSRIYLCKEPTQSVPLLVAKMGFFRRVYLSNVFKTFLLCLNVVFAHSICASLALAIALSIPSGVEGFTRPSSRPLAGQ